MIKLVKYVCMVAIYYGIKTGTSVKIRDSPRYCISYESSCHFSKEGNRRFEAVSQETCLQTQKLHFAEGEGADILFASPTFFQGEI